MEMIFIMFIVFNLLLPFTTLVGGQSPTPLPPTPWPTSPTTSPTASPTSPTVSPTLAPTSPTASPTMAPVAADDVFVFRTVEGFKGEAASSATSVVGQAATYESYDYTVKTFLAAHDKCQREAIRFGKSGLWRAYLGGVGGSQYAITFGHWDAVPGYGNEITGSIRSMQNQVVWEWIGDGMYGVAPLAPFDFYANGSAPVASEGKFWSGMNNSGDGEVSCTNAFVDYPWVTSGNGTAGSLAYPSSTSWLGAYSVACDTLLPLLCVGGDALGTFVAPSATVFATQAKYSINLLSAIHPSGDAFHGASYACMSEAVDAGIADPAGFKAMIGLEKGSPSLVFDSNGISVLRGDIPLFKDVRRAHDGAIVFNSMNDAYNGVPLVAFNFAVTGEERDGLFWSTMDADGSAGAGTKNCGDWNSTSLEGFQLGDASQLSASWETLGGVESDCGAFHTLICIGGKDLYVQNSIGSFTTTYLFWSSGTKFNGGAGVDAMNAVCSSQIASYGATNILVVQAFLGIDDGLLFPSYEFTSSALPYNSSVFVLGGAYELIGPVETVNGSAPPTYLGWAGFAPQFYPLIGSSCSNWTTSSAASYATIMKMDEVGNSSWMSVGTASCDTELPAMCIAVKHQTSLIIDYSLINVEVKMGSMPNDTTILYAPLNYDASAVLINSRLAVKATVNGGLLSFNPSVTTIGGSQMITFAGDSNSAVITLTFSCYLSCSLSQFKISLRGLNGESGVFSECATFQGFTSASLLVENQGANVLQTGTNLNKFCGTSPLSGPSDGNGNVDVTVQENLLASIIVIIQNEAYGGDPSRKRDDDDDVETLKFVTRKRAETPPEVGAGGTGGETGAGAAAGGDPYIFTSVGAIFHFDAPPNSWFSLFFDDSSALVAINSHTTSIERLPKSHKRGVLCDAISLSLGAHHRLLITKDASNVNFISVNSSKETLLEVVRRGKKERVYGFGWAWRFQRLPAHTDDEDVGTIEFVAAHTFEIAYRLYVIRVTRKCFDGDDGLCAELRVDVRSPHVPFPPLANGVLGYLERPEIAFRLKNSKDGQRYFKNSPSAMSVLPGTIDDYLLDDAFDLPWKLITVNKY